MLTLQQVYAVLFLHLGVILVMTAYFVVARMVFPTIVSRGQQRFARRAWLPAIIGIGLSIPWVLISVVLMQQGQVAPPLPVIGILFGGAWLLVAFVGAASLAGYIGRGSNDDVTPWKATMRGGVALTLTWALPFIGWMFILPLTLSIGVGCAVLGLFPLREASTRAAARPRLQTQDQDDERLERQLSGDLAFNDGGTH